MYFFLIFPFLLWAHSHLSSTFHMTASMNFCLRSSASKCLFHRIMKYYRISWGGRVIKSNPGPVQDNPKNHTTISKSFLNSVRFSAVTTSLESLFQCPTPFWVKSFSLIFNLNLLWPLGSCHWSVPVSSIVPRLFSIVLPVTETGLTGL